MTYENHPYLKQVARIGLAIPGAKLFTRVFVRHLIQKWRLNKKNRQRLYNFFAREVSTGQIVNCSTVLPMGGYLRLRLDLDDDLSRNWYFFGYRGYEPGMVNLLCELLPSKSVVVEAGANIGYYSLFMASILHKIGAVYVFEPWPEVADYLQYNAQLNDLSNLHLNRGAVADTDGQQTLFLPANFAWTNASLIADFTHQDRRVVVPTRRLDTFCAEQQLPKIDLLKIDVEGAELMALNGLGSLLLQWLPDIICEVLPPYEAELDLFFQDTPYRKFLITDNGLEEKVSLCADPRYRDYYLSCNPAVVDKLIGSR